MNRIIKLGVSFTMLIISSLSVAQCPSDDLVKKVSTKLNGFTFLKSFKIDKAKEDVEYSYVFTSNTNYVISLGNTNGNDGNIEINLFDSSRKLVLSNKLKDKTFPVITYACKATGIYYMTYKMADGACGVSVVGFKKI
ncbi:MAG: hypothetical protein U0V72_04920 [Cytophagales bacterium]